MSKLKRQGTVRKRQGQSGVQVKARSGDASGPARPSANDHRIIIAEPEASQDGGSRWKVLISDDDVPSLDTPSSLEASRGTARLPMRSGLFSPTPPQSWRRYADILIRARIFQTYDGGVTWRVPRLGCRLEAHGAKSLLDQTSQAVKEYALAERQWIRPTDHALPIWWTQDPGSDYHALRRAREIVKRHVREGQRQDFKTMERLLELAEQYRCRWTDHDIQRAFLRARRGLVTDLRETAAALIAQDTPATRGRILTWIAHVLHRLDIRYEGQTQDQIKRSLNTERRKSKGDAERTRSEMLTRALMRNIYPPKPQ